MHTLHIESPAIPTYAGEPALIPTHFTGTEGINTLFSYTLTLKTANAMQEVLDIAANFDRLQFIGQPLTVKIHLNNVLHEEDKSVREINGIITDITLSHREARHYVYQITLSPWLYLATLRRNSRIYQDKPVIQIIEDILGLPANLGHAFECQTTSNYPSLDYVTQFNETDFDFFSRLCEEWGINYFFTHQDGKHTLQLVDDMNTFKLVPYTQYQSIPFYEDTHDIDVGTEYIHQLTLTHQMTTGKYATNDYDYKNTYSNGLHASNVNPLVQGLASQEVYSWNEMTSYAQPHGYHSESVGKKLAEIRMEAIHAQSYRSMGQGNIRGIVPGTLFKLENHPYQEANDQWLVTQTTLTIEASPETSLLHFTEQQDQVSCQFDVFPISQIFRPQLETARPLSHGPQIAIVTTDDENNQISTDSLGRIKVKFMWDRYADNSNQNSCWIRVATSWAGMSAGTMYLPRKGQEVIIDYIGGNIDSPICTGQVYNQSHPTPWPLPTNQAISGIKTAELNQSGRSNYLLMDDTPGEIQTQLCSEHQNSRLSLGAITQLPNQSTPNREVKSEGFYLETQGQGNIKAESGMTLSTSFSPNFGLLATYINIGTSFVQHLTTHQHPVIPTGKYAEFNKINKSLRNLLIYETTYKTLAPTSVFHDADPSINISSASNVNISSLSSTHVMSSSLLTLSSTDHTSVNVGQSLIASVREYFSLFVKTKDFIVNTLKGNIVLHAQENNIEMSAENQVLMHSLKNDIEISAYKKLMLQGKKSDVELQSDEKSVHIKAKKHINVHALENLNLNASEKLILRALKHLTIECKDDAIIISSPKKVIIKGGTSQSTWSSQGIKHSTLGKWEQKASSHQMSTPKASNNKAEQKQFSTAKSTPILTPTAHDISAKYKYEIIKQGAAIIDFALPIVYQGIPHITIPDAIRLFKPIGQRIVKHIHQSSRAKLFIKEMPKQVLKIRFNKTPNKLITHPIDNTDSKVLTYDD